MEEQKAVALSTILPYWHELVLSVNHHLGMAGPHRVDKRVVAAAAGKRLGFKFKVSRAQEMAVIYRYACTYGVVVNTRIRRMA